MMWLAGLLYFEQRGVDVAYSTHINGYNAATMRRALGDGLIVFNGGVGLSTLWPSHTDIKRRVSTDFPDHRILVFPSTAAFANRADQDSVRGIFCGKRDVVLMARDAESHRTIGETFPEAETILVPDSAFFLPSYRRRRPAQHDITWLVRNDHESIGYQAPAGVHTFDWAARSLRSTKDVPRAYLRVRASGVARRVRDDGRLGRLAERAANRLVDRLYRKISEELMAVGNDDLDLGKVVVTDRFHTHILAILRRQPVVLLVDAYGKNKNSYDTWTRRFGNVRLASNPEEALAVARTLASQAS
jgi:exopolysaccharide biosynthesis predicted pyruvyltransferase EpsI